MIATPTPAMPGVSPDLRLLVLEDDELLRDQVLVPRLGLFGFKVDAIGSVAELGRHLEHPPDIVLLDVGLPDGDGYEVARQLRARFSGIGIVLLTGRGEATDQVRGLSEGADAYVAKPFDIYVLGATLHSLARRLRASAPQAGGWRLDAEGWYLMAPSGGIVALTKTERRLLEVLIEQANRVVSREALIAALTDDIHDFDPHRLDSLIHRLRRKVQRELDVPLPLNAVHGEGYVLVLR
jgi:DNA-binding response OmpR family regulator